MKREKYRVGRFTKGQSEGAFDEVEDWINEQAAHRGELLATPTANLAQNATSLAVALADPGLNAHRKARFVKPGFEDLDVISAAAIAVSITRTSPAAHAEGTAVRNAEGEVVGVLSAALSAQVSVNHAFTATPVPLVSGGSGTGAAITSISVDAQGRITAVVWANGSTGYAEGDTLTLQQGHVTVRYTLLAADVSAGVLQDLASKELQGQEHGFAMTEARERISAGDDLTIGDGDSAEAVVVRALATTITFARPTGNAAITAPYEVRDDNGPYAYEDAVDMISSLAVVVEDAN